MSRRRRQAHRALWFLMSTAALLGAVVMTLSIKHNGRGGQSGEAGRAITSEEANHSPRQSPQVQSPPSNFADLARSLEARGFKVEPVLEDGSPADPEMASTAKVVAQSPSSLEEIPVGASVRVVVDCGSSCAAGAKAAHCLRPVSSEAPEVTASRLRPGEPFRLTGTAPEGEAMVVALLEKSEVAAPGPFAKYLGAGKASPVPTCKYDVALVIPSNVKPGRYSLFVMFDGAALAGPAILIEVIV